MNIVQIVPNWNKFLPTTAVGIRGVVRDLCLGLKARGHTVKLIAARGSEFPDIEILETTIDLAGLGLSSKDPASWAYRVAHAAEALPLLKKADIVHSHLEHVLLPFTSLISQPIVHTLHSIDYDDQDKFLFREFPNGTFAAVSQRHATLLSKFVRASEVCYNGIDTDTYTKTETKGDYLLWIGRYVPEKGAETAVSLARKLNMHTIMAGFVNKKYASYFDELKKQEKKDKLEIFNESLGEEKINLLQNAKAFLMPITWEEPFGLTMIEAMACGVPVIGYNRGSVPEVVKDGVTGFIIEPVESETSKSPWKIKKTGLAGFVEAIKRIGEIDRSVCRKRVIEHFTIGKMVERYEVIYKKLLHTKI